MSVERVTYLDSSAIVRLVEAAPESTASLFAPSAAQAEQQPATAAAT
jgi:hypothetical protein